jgi:hypothetical protein
MKRLLFVLLAFLVGCNGGGGAGSALLPQGPTTGVAADAIRPVKGPIRPIGDPKHPGRTNVKVTMRIPRRNPHESAVAQRHPATISPATTSVSISVNGAAATVFNTTPTSSGCSAGSSGTTCTFSVGAPIGTDAFKVTTYSGVNAGGSILDQGTAVVKIVAGTANSPAVKLGPVVSTADDGVAGSLRYAIGNASPGDTIMFLTGVGSTLTLYVPITISTNVTVAGPGVTTSVERVTDGSFRPHGNYSGITITGANMTQLFIVQAGANVAFNGLVLTGGKANTAHEPGGLIDNLGTLALTGDALTASTSAVTTAVHGPVRPKTAVASKSARLHRHPFNPPACTTTYGGAVYNDGTLTISGSTFDGNALTGACGYGGAIYNDTSGILSDSGSTYVNNAAYKGGAVYTVSNFPGSFTNDTFSTNTGCTSATGCATTCSSASSACTSYAQGSGAAIYDNSAPGITVTGSTFTGNVDGGATQGSSGSGAALYLGSGSPVIASSTFTDNAAGGGSTSCSEGYGGAVYFAGTSLTLTGDTFTGNQATGDDGAEGGAVYSQDPIQGSSNTFTSNSASSVASACQTTPTNAGGALFVESTLSMSASSFLQNTATSTNEAIGGAIAFSGTAATLTSDTFTSNVASVSGSTASPWANGGAVDGENGVITLTGNTFSKNQATIGGSVASGVAAGGAVYQGSSSMTSTRDSYTSNTATATNGTSNSAYGGAMYASGSLAINAGTFQSNSASGANFDDGGAVYANGSLSLASSTFTSNAVSGLAADGGALVAEGTGQVSGSTFTSNTVTSTGVEGFGGAIDDEGGMTIAGNTISNNSATLAGGGIYADNSETVTDSKITGNAVTHATLYYGGGGIYGDDSLTIDDSTISGNTVAVSAANAGGGGVYNNDGLSMTGTTVSGNSVTGSTQSSSGGGGIYNYDNATIYDSTIASNTSSINGGGFEQLDVYDVTLINDTFYQNSAPGGLGGNIDNPNNITLTNSIVAGGTGGSGADIYNGGTLTSGDYNIIQTAIVGSGTVSGTTTHNLQKDPKLLSLATNGGPTQTIADQAGISPGVAYIPFISHFYCGPGDSIGIVADQRNYLRGASGFCDVGAYEAGGVPTAIRVAPPRVRSSGKPKRHRQIHRPIRKPVDSMTTP